MKKYLPILFVIIILFSFISCKKKEEEKVTQPPLAQGPILDTKGIKPHGDSGKKIQFEVVVPPDVESAWSAVTLVVEDKQLNKTQEYNVQIGDEFKIPESAVTVKVAYFLPDFKMSGSVITSASNTPNNPSIGVVISEDGKQIFPGSGKLGWLYAKFPTIHPFQHERFGLTLKEGI
jgi:hypothetical protein